MAMVHARDRELESNESIRINKGDKMLEFTDPIMTENQDYYCGG